MRPSISETAKKINLIFALDYLPSHFEPARSRTRGAAPESHLVGADLEQRLLDRFRILGALGQRGAQRFADLRRRDIFDMRDPLEAHTHQDVNCGLKARE